MPRLVLGPLLRHVDATRATVWVETDQACTVGVLGASQRTFCVAGHHYALVLVTGLVPGSTTEYDVRLDDETVWPEPDSKWPPSVIRTIGEAQEIVLAFGSCRVTAPGTARVVDKIGVDAMQAMAARMAGMPVKDWPDALMLLGDQVYADEVSPRTEDRIKAQRDTSHPPGTGIANFEEYTWLYEEAWSEPTVRWLMSTVPTSMIFDDHDVHDDWNTSAAWRASMAAEPWWLDRITGGLTAYWIYQHLGNLSPEELQANEVYADVLAAADGGPLLCDFAECADAEADGAKGARWSYRRDLGRTRLLVLDSRCGRVLEGGHREMIDQDEWDWVVAQTEQTGEVDHLLIASSLPVLLPPALHSIESWNEAVCDGAWGPRAARLGEKMRQAVDLEHWAAFHRSFDGLLNLMAEVGSGERGPAPASIVMLSGDVHFAYSTQAHYPESDGVRSVVWQAVCSPVRNPVPKAVQWGQRFLKTTAGRNVGRALARRAGVQPPRMIWEMCDGPVFNNALATLRLSGREARLVVERAVPTGAVDDDGRLEECFSRDLTAGTDRESVA